MQPGFNTAAVPGITWLRRIGAVRSARGTRPIGPRHSGRPALRVRPPYSLRPDRLVPPIFTVATVWAVCAVCTVCCGGCSELNNPDARDILEASITITRSTLDLVRPLLLDGRISGRATPAAIADPETAARQLALLYLSLSGGPETPRDPSTCPGDDECACTGSTACPCTKAALSAAGEAKCAADELAWERLRGTMAVDCTPAELTVTTVGAPGFVADLGPYCAGCTFAGRRAGGRVEVRVRRLGDAWLVTHRFADWSIERGLDFGATALGPANVTVPKGGLRGGEFGFRGALEVLAAPGAGEYALNFKQLDRFDYVNKLGHREVASEGEATRIVMENEGLGIDAGFRVGGAQTWSTGSTNPWRLTVADAVFLPGFDLPTSGRFEIRTPTKRDEALILSFERDGDSVRATLEGYGREMVFVVGRSDR